MSRPAVAAVPSGWMKPQEQVADTILLPIVADATPIKPSGNGPLVQAAYPVIAIGSGARPRSGRPRAAARRSAAPRRRAEPASEGVAIAEREIIVRRFGPHGPKSRFACRHTTRVVHVRPRPFRPSGGRGEGAGGGAAGREMPGPAAAAVPFAPRRRRFEALGFRGLVPVVAPLAQIRQVLRSLAKTTLEQNTTSATKKSLTNPAVSCIYSTGDRAVIARNDWSRAAPVPPRTAIRAAPAGGTPATHHRQHETEHHDRWELWRRLCPPHFCPDRSSGVQSRAKTK